MRGPAAMNPWIQRFHPSPECGMRLVCFPYAGGSATYYFPLSQKIAPGLEVIAVQYPGRQERHRESCVDNIHALAEGIAGALLEWSDRPFAFFGHSMGAVVAFETARRLRSEGRDTPVRLFVSGRRAPSCPRRGRIHQYDDAGIVAELVGMGATNPRLLDDEEIRAAIVSVVRADYRAIETYAPVPGASVECPVTVMLGDADPQTTLEEAAAWRQHCGAEFDLKTFSGGHFYLDTNWSEVIEMIHRDLTGVSH